MPDWESWLESGFFFLSRQEAFMRERQLIMNLASASPSATAGLIPNPKARLLDQVREVMRFHHYSLRTEEAYLQWIRIQCWKFDVGSSTFRGANVELSTPNVDRRTKAVPERCTALGASFSLVSLVSLVWR